MAVAIESAALEEVGKVALGVAPCVSGA
jgi:hypothetical protein